MPTKNTPRATTAQIAKAKWVGAEIATHLLREDIRYESRPTATFYRSEIFKRSVSVRFMLAVVGEVFGKTLAANYKSPEESKRLNRLRDVAIEAAVEAAEKFIRDQ